MAWRSLPWVGSRARARCCWRSCCLVVTGGFGTAQQGVYVPPRCQTVTSCPATSSRRRRDDGDPRNRRRMIRRAVDGRARRRARCSRRWAAGEARFVGGAVRDALLGGREIGDIDIATPPPPDGSSRRSTSAGIKAVPTGLAHGTVTAVGAAAAFRDHHAAPRCRDLRPPCARRLRRRLGGGCGAARFHDQRALPRS